jgi:hypothetical protein
VRSAARDGVVAALQTPDVGGAQLLTPSPLLDKRALALVVRGSWCQPATLNFRTAAVRAMAGKVPLAAHLGRRRAAAVADDSNDDLESHRRNCTRVPYTSNTL